MPEEGWIISGNEQAIGRQQQQQLVRYNLCKSLVVVVKVNEDDDGGWEEIKASSLEDINAQY